MPDDAGAGQPGWPDLLFWLGRPAEVGSRVTLEADESHHLLRVARLKVGDRAALADGAGHWLLGRLVGSAKGRAEVEIDDRRVSPAEPRRELHIGFSPLRPGRTDVLLEKGTELGATRFTPLSLSRSREGHVRRERWERVIRSAAMQSLRSRPPELGAPLSLEGWIASLPEEGARWVARPGGEAAPDAGSRPVAAIAGPEGDFDPGEWSRLAEGGFRGVDLGPRRLRSETAAIALIVRIQAPCWKLGETDHGSA